METSVGDKTILVDFTSLLIARAADLIGADEISKIVGTKIGRGFLGFGSDKAAIALAREKEEGLRNKIAALITLLLNAFGTTLVERTLEDIYTRLEKKHSPALANTLILPLIPGKFLEKYRLHFLSKEELETRILEKTREVDELNELDRRKSEFLSVVAHQLRTPLTGIKWALTMLLHTTTEPLGEEQKKLILACNEGNERMIAIVNDMLRADRVNMGTFTLTPTSTDFLALITDVMKEMYLTETEHTVTVTLTHDEHIPLLMLDQEMMRFALQNLLDNAIKYSVPGGTVSVRVSLKDASVECAITDTGIGIPSDQQSYIFSRFFRARNAIATRPNGNGLGLSIVKNIVEKQGGTIGFTSEENKGTTFRFSLTL